MNATNSAQLYFFIQNILCPLPLGGCWLEIISVIQVFLGLQNTEIVYFNAAAFSIRNLHCVVARRPHKEFNVTYGCFLTLKKALITIKICGCRCMAVFWLEQLTLSLEWTSTVEFHLLTQIKDQVMMKPTYYQLYFSKSSHAEVKLKHTLETSPESPNNLQTLINPHTGKPFDFHQHISFPISAAALSLSSSRDWYQYCDATWIKNNCRNQQLISAPSPALGERTYFPFPCLLTRTNVT